MVLIAFMGGANNKKVVVGKVGITDSTTLLIDYDKKFIYLNMLKYDKKKYKYQNFNRIRIKNGFKYYTVAKSDSSSVYVDMYFYTNGRVDVLLKNLQTGFKTKVNLK
jgi:hypothetical protein